MQHAGDNMYKM